MEAAATVPEPSLDGPMCKDDTVFTSSYEDDVFTFLIGEERRRFNVHVSVLKCISEPLGFMMTNGKMAESIEKEAILPDVEPITFGMLVEYAYNGLCGLVKSFAIPDPLLSFLPSTFYCHTCAGSISAGKGIIQYPFCSVDCRQRYWNIRAHMASCGYRHGYGDCNDELHGAIVYCVVDGAGFQHTYKCIDQLFCRACIGASPGKSYPDYKTDIYSESDMITKCTSNFSSKKYSNPKLTHDEMSDHIQRHSTGGKQSGTVDNCILRFANLYVLATKYMVNDLPEICLHRIHNCLLYFEINSESIAELTKMLLYVYENTSDDGSIVDGTGDKLRDLVITYTVDRAKDVMQYEAFRYQGMLGAGGAPSADFMAVVYGNTTS